MRSKNEKFARCCILPASVACRKKLMIWGFICSTGEGGYAVVDGRVTAASYQQLLTENLLPFLDDIPLSRAAATIFQQDNAPPHSAGATRAFLAQAVVTVTDWPALSPDLNPIENLWAIMKREVRMHHPQTLQELRKAIDTAWTRAVTPDLCRRLFASLHTRIHRVLRHAGLRLQ